MENLFLIYVHFIGENHKGYNLYEFIYSDTIENIDGEEWDTYPASGRPKPPYDNLIKKIGVLETDLKLDLIVDSSLFAVWDAVDGVIALAWENINAYDSYPEHRLSFNFGSTIKDVNDKLYEKDLILEYNKKTYDKQK